MLDVRGWLGVVVAAWSCGGCGGDGAGRGDGDAGRGDGDGEPDVSEIDAEAGEGVDVGEGEGEDGGGDGEVSEGVDVGGDGDVGVDADTTPEVDTWGEAFARVIPDDRLVAMRLDFAPGDWEKLLLDWQQRQVKNVYPAAFALRRRGARGGRRAAEGAQLAAHARRRHVQSTRRANTR